MESKGIEARRQEVAGGGSWLGRLECAVWKMFYGAAPSNVIVYFYCNRSIFTAHCSPMNREAGQGEVVAKEQKEHHPRQSSTDTSYDIYTWQRLVCGRK